MPIPKPNEGESQKDFISRCMANPTMNSDYPENDQRAAVCYSAWKDAKKNLYAGSGFAGGYLSTASTPFRTYLARHGTTDYNGHADSPEKIRGHLDVPLSDEGRAQATAMGKALKDKNISMLFSSDLSRAKETADLMSKEMDDIPVLPQNGLRPWRLGKNIEGQVLDDNVLGRISHLVDNPDEADEDGESLNAFKDRFLNSWKRIHNDYPGENVGIVTHYRGIKLLDAYNAKGKTGELDKDEFKNKDTSCPPGSYKCLDKNGDDTGEKSISMPGVLYRDMTFDETSIDKDSGQVRLSVSSDKPYERHFGTEILDHSPGSIRLDRFNKGAPLLFNHNPDAHIGRVLSASTDGNKLNIIAKFSNSMLGREKKQDVDDGILKEASIGYSIYDMTENPKGVFTATDWEPYEGSLVTVPADTGVGVNRDAPMRLVRLHSPGLVDNSKTSMSQTTATQTATEIKVDIVAERNKAVADFQARCKKIDDWAAEIKNPRWQEAVREIADKHKRNSADFEAFKVEAVNSFDPAKHIEVPDTKVGMSKKDRGQFRICNLIRDLADPARADQNSFEKEACNAAYQHLRKLGDPIERAGFTLPEDMAHSNFQEDNDLDTRSLSNLRQDLIRLNRNLAASTGSTGGYLIGVDLLTGSIIELLRNKALVMNLGPTLLGGLVNNIAIPKVLTGATVSWFAEGASVTETDQSFGQLALSPHRLAVDTAYTKQLVNQASLSVEAFVRDDFARQAAVERDRVYLNGGINPGEPLGVFNTPGVQTITYGATPTWAKIVQGETDIEGANAILGPMTWLTTPAGKSKLKTTVVVAASTFPIFLWMKGDAPAINGVMAGEMNAYPAYATKNVPGDKTIFGVWSELIIADWAGIDIVVDPYSLKKQEQVEVTMNQWLDCGIRHPVAFEVSTDSANQ